MIIVEDVVAKEVLMVTKMVAEVDKMAIETVGDFKPNKSLLPINVQSASTGITLEVIVKSIQTIKVMDSKEADFNVEQDVVDFPIMVAVETAKVE